MMHELRRMFRSAWVVFCVTAFAGIAPKLLAFEGTTENVGIRVVDSVTGEPVPMVELESTHGVIGVTDNQGYAAFAEPDWIGEEVFLFGRSPGYRFPKDGFGYSGVRIRFQPGKTESVPIERVSIAQRVARVTGQGRYRDSQLLGQAFPELDRNRHGRSVGQDSVQSVKYQNQIYWIWGDTSKLSYPLGMFRASGATTPLPSPENLDQLRRGLLFEYFVDPDSGFVRPMMPLPERPEGVVWIFSLVRVLDQQESSSDQSEGASVERLVAFYTRRKALTEELERGLAVFNPEKQIFEPVVSLESETDWRKPTGHPISFSDHDGDWILFGSPNPNVRVKADFESVLDTRQYQALGFASPSDAGATEPTWSGDHRPLTSSLEKEMLSSGEQTNSVRSSPRFYPYDVDEPTKRVQLHSGTVRWNTYRDRWILVAGEVGGSQSFLGEVWYSEARHPTGPFERAVKILSHDQHSFYNVCHHNFLDSPDGREIYFEGTFTIDFSGLKRKTPRFDYNQIMYRLDLSDPRILEAFADR